MPREERSRYFAAALSTFVAFAAIGLFAGLAGLIALDETPRHVVAFFLSRSPTNLVQMDSSVLQIVFEQS